MGEGHNDRLAIHGGEPVRRKRMPPRLALGDDEVGMIQRVIAYYRDNEIDPGYQGPFEKLYTDGFVGMMGGGYADAVATGTASLFVALAALDLPKGSQVLISPITDPGSLSAIILNGLTPKLCDSKPGSYNIGVEQVVARLTPEVSAICLVHAAGQAAEADKIVEAAHARGVRVLEDPKSGARRQNNGPPGRQLRRHRRVLDDVSQGAHDRPVRRCGLLPRSRPFSPGACPCRPGQAALA